MNEPHDPNATADIPSAPARSLTTGVTATVDKPADPLGKLVLELDQVVVGRIRLKARDQDVALLQNGDRHAASSIVIVPYADSRWPGASIERMTR